MHNMPILKPGDSVDIIAPASRCSDQLLAEIKELLTSWDLKCRATTDIFGPDLLCANTDTMRFKFLQDALLNHETKAVICARGGYGSMRLIPELIKITPPKTAKLFIGMSDITALNLFLQQEWHWPVIHGALALDKFSQESIAAVKSILFAEKPNVEFIGVPLNSLAQKSDVIRSTVTGGNLSLLQTSIGTSWQIDGCNKIIFIEEVSERGYRVDRMLEHLRQAGIFMGATAIFFGDFSKGEEPDKSSLIKPVLERFAQDSKIPVFQVNGIGHDHTSFPLPLGTPAMLTLGNEIKLVCAR